MAHRRPLLLRALQLNTAVMNWLNSFSLIMDGVHNLSDAVALVLLVLTHSFREGLSGTKIPSQP